MSESRLGGLGLMSLSHRLQRCFLRSGRSAIATAACVAYLLAVTGVPLPVKVVKDRSQPFPCMHSACGCASAAQCWQSCCCTTPQERLAWARERGIEPPRSLTVLAALRRAGDRRAHSCCEAKPLREQNSHCCESEQPREVASQPLETPEFAVAEQDDGLIVISAWRACHGLAPLWSFLGAALAAPPSLCYEFDWRPSAWLSLSSDASASICFSPDIPPPRA